MAKKINIDKLRNSRDNILHGSSFFEKEAYELGVTTTDIYYSIADIYEGRNKNTQFKAIVLNSQKNSAKVPVDELKKFQSFAGLLEKKSKKT